MRAIETAAIDFLDQSLRDRLTDADAIAAEYFFIERIGRKLAYLMRRFDYEELLQDLYVHLSEDRWRRLRTFQFASSLDTWTVQVAFRLCLNRKRRMRLQNEVERQQTPVEFAHNPFKAEIARQSREWLLIAIERYLISSRDRAVLRMLFFDEMTPEEVAASLRIKITNVYVIKQRALERLRQQMAGVNPPVRSGSPCPAGFGHSGLNRRAAN